MMEFVSAVALILCLLVGYIVVIRVTKPHSKRMGRNGAQHGASAPSVGAPVAPASTPKERFAWIAEYLWTIVLIIAGLVIFFQGVYSSEWKTPSFSTVGSWSWNHWLQLLVLWGIGSALLALNKKALGAAVPVLQSLLTGMAVMAFLVCPVIGWFEGSSSTSKPQTVMKAPVVECTKLNRCVPTLEKVSLPNRKRVCFEGSFWRNKNMLGFHTSYRGGQELHDVCTRQQVIDGMCAPYDAFRFAPESGVSLPRYWFVDERELEC